MPAVLSALDYKLKNKVSEDEDEDESDCDCDRRDVCALYVTHHRMNYRRHGRRVIANLVWSHQRLN